MFSAATGSAVGGPAASDESRNRGACLRKRLQTLSMEEGALRINQKYAEEYERRKRREELSRLRDLERERRRERRRGEHGEHGGATDGREASSHGSGTSDDEDDEDEEEDECAVLLTRKMDAQWAATLEAIRRRDARIYDANHRFYDSDSGSSSSSGDEPVAGYETVAAAGGGRETGLLLKDYVRQQLLAEGSEGGSSSTESEGVDTRAAAPRQRDGDAVGGHVPVYDAEQAELRRAVLNQSARMDDETGERDDVHSDDAEDDLFQLKRRDALWEDIAPTARENGQLTGEEAAAASTVVPSVSAEDDGAHAYLEQETADEKERFLREFVLRNGWLSVGAAGSGASPARPSVSLERRHTPTDESDTVCDASASTDSVEEDEAFLQKQEQFEYAHNFRYEEACATQVPTHPRRVPDSMRRPSSKSEARRRQRDMRQQRKEVERRRREEELKRLKNLRRAEQAERIQRLARAAGCEAGDETAAVFAQLLGDDDDAGFDPDKHDRLMGAHFESEVYRNAPDADLEQRRRLEDAEAAAWSDDQDDREREDAMRPSRSHGRSADLTDTLEHHLDQLDREDVLAGTRFHYRPIDPVDCGLSALDVLDMDDKELNRFVSIKYYRPFRPPDSLPRRIRKLFRGNVSMKRHRLARASRPEEGGRASHRRGLSSEQRLSAEDIRRRAYGIHPREKK